MTDKQEKPPPWAELLDLRSVTRDADTFTTTVLIRDPETYRSVVWIKAGKADLRNEGDQQFLRIRLDYGVTDFEHDSAIAVNIDLIGLKFESVYNGTLCAKAWIATEKESMFRVPQSGYNPSEADDVLTCESCKKPHPLVEYLPEENHKLWHKLRGSQIEIRLGPYSDWKPEGETS